MDFTCRITYINSQLKINAFNCIWKKLVYIELPLDVFLVLSTWMRMVMFPINYTWGKHQVNNHYNKYNLLE
jgi:hypothetical protein